MKFKVISFELVSRPTNQYCNDFVRIKFEQEYTDTERIEAPRSTAELCLSTKDKIIPRFVKMINTGELIENPFAEFVESE